MLTQEQNERLTRVGPGTPGGELLRRYWQPLAASADLVDKQTKKVRLLGEDLALFRDRSAASSASSRSSAHPHRRCSLAYGVPRENGIRCPYHGWLFDQEGNAASSSPPSRPNSMFKDRIKKTVSYPVREVGGIFWTYMGPGEPPVFPEHDYLVQENTVAKHRCDDAADQLAAGDGELPRPDAPRVAAHIGMGTTTPDRAVDHTETSAGSRRPGCEGIRLRRHRLRDRQAALASTRVVPRRTTTGRSVYPVLFPNILKVGTSLQIRIIVDDTHTLHLLYSTYSYEGVQAPHQEVVPTYDVPYLNEDGSYAVDGVLQQDMMAWVTQGSIADRTVEHLGASDRGVMLYRKVFEENLRRIEAGEEPMFVYRDKAFAGRIEIPIDTVESAKAGRLRCRAGPGENPRQTGQFSWLNEPDPEKMLAQLNSIYHNQSRSQPDQRGDRMRCASSHAKIRGAA